MASLINQSTSNGPTTVQLVSPATSILLDADEANSYELRIAAQELFMADMISAMLRTWAIAAFIVSLGALILLPPFARTAPLKLKVSETHLLLSMLACIS